MLRIFFPLCVMLFMITACTKGNYLSADNQFMQAPDYLSSGKPAVSSNTTSLILRLKGGDVRIKLMPDLAPLHVERVKRLASEGFYNGLIFHRVIPGFMAQTGDPTGTGSGGSKYPDLRSEFSQYIYRRGTVGAARSTDLDSANSQFFICFNDTGCRGLTGQYTVWGQVVSGMRYVDKVSPGEPPSVPDRIRKAYIEIGAVSSR